jgi:taurine dioxygenase
VAGAGVTIEPMTPTIGAEVAGIDLRRPLDDDAVAFLRAALLEHQVLFFRDQDLTVDEQIAFGQCFGELDIPPFRHDGVERPELTVLDQTNPKGEGADSWHADYTYRAEPPMASILKAVQLPPLGGDTCFASMTAAYDALSPAMRAFLDTLHAENTLAIMGERLRDHPTAKLRRPPDGEWPYSIHPVVRVHPETGRKLLNVNANWTSRIVDLSRAESDALLALLFEHLKSPDFQCRFRWQPNSVAFWDNRAVQHFAVADYTNRRVMQRITVVGDRPYGVEGPPAEATDLVSAGTA